MSQSPNEPKLVPKLMQTETLSMFGVFTEDPDPLLKHITGPHSATTSASPAPHRLLGAPRPVCAIMAASDRHDHQQQQHRPQDTTTITMTSDTQGQRHAHHALQQQQHCHQSATTTTTTTPTLQCHGTEGRLSSSPPVGHATDELHAQGPSGHHTSVHHGAAGSHNPGAGPHSSLSPFSQVQQGKGVFSERMATSLCVQRAMCAPSRAVVDL